VRRTPSDQVEEAVSVGSLVRLLQFKGGTANLIEVTLAEGSPADGVRLSDLNLARGATVVAVVRHDRLVVPRGDTVLSKGDEVLVLAIAEAESAVPQLLIGP
jgi:trk system potassium uptake protein TrkA